MERPNHVWDHQDSTSPQWDEKVAPEHPGDKGESLDWLRWPSPAWVCRSPFWLQEPHPHSVDFFNPKQKAIIVLEWEPVSERLVRVRLNSKYCTLTILQRYTSAGLIVKIPKNGNIKNYQPTTTNQMETATDTRIRQELASFSKGGGCMD